MTKYYSLRAAALPSVVITLFVLVALLGMPFRYDEGRSGRYLLGVLRAADAELFSNDPVVESLTRFKSLFYLSLQSIYRMSGASPETLEPLMHVLYVGYKLALIIILWAISRSLSEDFWLFILLGAWGTYMEPVPIGGGSLFRNTMTHSEVAILLALTAFYFLLRSRYISFWLFLSLGVLVHPLHTVHFVLCIVPTMLLTRCPIRKGMVIGFAIFSITAVFYFLFMAPPAMSTEEAHIFIAAKGRMQHVSPFNQSLMGWIRMGTLMALSLLSFKWYGERSSRNERLIYWSIISGLVLALLLSLAAITTQFVRLVQFQPMRIFVWVTFFSYLLLALTTIKVSRRIPMAGALLVGVFVFSILSSLWALPFMFMAIIDLIVRRYLRQKMETGVRAWDRVVLAVIILTVVGMWVLYGIRDQFETPIATFRNPLFPIAGALLLGYLFVMRRAKLAWQLMLSVSLLGFTMFGAGVHWHRYYDSKTYPEWDASIYKARTHPDWDTVREWCREHTSKTARFIIAGGYGSFRLRAWRTAVGNSMSALAWVDPQEYVHNEKRALRVRKCWRDGHWDLKKLIVLAGNWHVDFIVLRGAYRPALIPIFQIGSFSVIEVPSS